MANKYDLELALDSYRAQNGRESEVGLMDSWDGIQYGSQRFSSREQAMWWLKQQKPNHDAIQKMIAEERKNYPNSGLGPLMDTYEKYYKQVQAVQSQTEKKLGEEKVVPKAEESVQTIPGETRRVDGLPEPTRYPPTPQTIPGPTRRIDGLPEPTRYPIAPAPVLPVKPQTIVGPPATTEPVRNISKEFTTAYNDLMVVAKWADKWFWEQDDKTVTTNKQKMGNAYANFQKALSALSMGTLSSADRADAEKKIRDVALYFSNSLSGVSNSHFRNYQLSAGLLISLLDKDSKGKDISGWPKMPTETEILAKFKWTESGKMILAHMESGAKFEDIIANPKIKGAWETVTKEVYGKYTAELEAFVKKLDTNQSSANLILTIPQQESLKALKALIGAGTGWDYFSAQTKDGIIGMGKAVPAILVGGAIAATGIGAWPGAFLIATGAGALVTTWGMMIAQNRLYTDPTEIAKEAGLNTITFWAGGVIFRLGGKYLSASKGLHYTNMWLLQPLGNVAVGASTDVIRGQLEKTDVRFTDAFWHNAPWALLPLVLASKGWKWTPKQVEWAKKTEQALHDIQRKAALWGDTTVAQKKLAQDVAEQSADVKNTVQPTPNPATSDLPPGWLSIGSKVEWATSETTAGKNTPSKASKPIQAGDVTTSQFHMDDTQFSQWTSGAVPKLDAKAFPVGSKIMAGNTEIKVLEWGKYEVVHDGKLYKFDTHRDLSDGIPAIIKTPAERMELMKSTTGTRIEHYNKSLDGHSIVGLDGHTYRWNYDPASKGLKIQKQDPKWKYWSDVDEKILSNADQGALISQYYKTTPTKIKKAQESLAENGADAVMTSLEKKWFIQRYGKDNLKKLDEAMKKAWSTPYIWWIVRPWSMTAAVITNVGVQWWEYFFSEHLGGNIYGTPGSPNKESWTENPAGNAVEFAYTVFLSRYFGIAWTLISTAVNSYPYIRDAKVKWAEVPATTQN
jgi:hypothetical protein